MTLSHIGSDDPPGKGNETECGQACEQGRIESW